VVGQNSDHGAPFLRSSNQPSAISHQLRPVCRLL